jgi:hypothetical protein
MDNDIAIPLSEAAVKGCKPANTCKNSRRTGYNVLRHFPIPNTRVVLDNADQWGLVKSFWEVPGGLPDLSPSNPRPRGYCDNHLRRIAQSVGFRIVDAKHEDLYAYLWDMYVACVRGRSVVVDLRAYRSTPHLTSRMLKDSRYAVPADELGVYRYFAKEYGSAESIGLSALPGHRLRTWKGSEFSWTRRAVGKALGVTAEHMAEFRETGNLVVDNLVSWLAPWEDNMWEEFKMYHWHLREINGRPNLGWCRTMIHSLTQQLIRQDPGYWMLYCLLRPDGTTWQISYPYYTKFTHPGDDTKFQHIDLNVKDMVQGKGINQIQGSISLTDESKGDSTFMVKGIHKVIKQWLESATENFKAIGRAVPDGKIHVIDETWLSKAFMAKHDLLWEDVVCRRWSARVTMPQIPHGARGPSKGVRLTILPWYVGIESDHETLEVAAGGT